MLPVTHYYSNSIDEETRDPRVQSWHALCSSCSRIWACWLIALFIYFNVCVLVGDWGWLLGVVSLSPLGIKLRLSRLAASTFPNSATSPALSHFLFSAKHIQKECMKINHTQNRISPPHPLSSYSCLQRPHCVSPNLAQTHQRVNSPEWHITKSRVLLCNFASCVCVDGFILSVSYVLKIIAFLRNLSPSYRATLYLHLEFLRATWAHPGS